MTPAPAAHLTIDEANVGRSVLRMAWPMVAERMSFGALAAVDGILVGRYVGEDGLAAVGIASLLFWLPEAAILGLATATTTVTGWDYGAHQFDRLRQTLRSALVMASLWGLVMVGVLILIAGPALELMGLEEAARRNGEEYMRLAAIGMLGYAVFDVGAGALRGLGNARTPMLIILLVNVLNGVITYLLISGAVGVELGMAAAGWGFGISGLIGGLVTLALLGRGYRGLRWRPGRALSFARTDSARLLRLAVPLTLEEMQFLLAFLAYVRIISSIGTDAVAAHTVAIRANELAIVVGFGLGAAATALVGQAMGAGRTDLAEAVARVTMKYALWVGVTLAVVFMILAPYIARVFTDDRAVIDQAVPAMRTFAIAFPALGVYAALAGTLRGAGDVKFVLLILTLTAWGVRVPAAFVGGRILEWGLAGAWMGAVIEIHTRSSLTWLRFRNGGWKRRRV